MKKLLLSVVALGFVATSMAQMAIPGKVFADNATRFNGRKVTLREVKLNMSVSKTTSNVNVIKPMSLNGAIMAKPITAPGSRQPIITCRPPRGFKEVDVDFISAPEYKACFFMSDAMFTQLMREANGQSVDAQITFRGDSRTGYNVSFYRLGK